MEGTFAAYPFVHTGVVEASGLVLDVEPASAWTVVRAQWHTGASLVQHRNRLVLIYAEPLRMDTSTVPGLPLVRYGSILSTVPLSQKRRAEYERQTTNALVIGESGQMVVVSRDDLTAPDITSWPDLGVRLIVGIPFKPPVITVPQDAFPPATVASRLEGMLPADPTERHREAVHRLQKPRGTSASPGDRLVRAVARALTFIERRISRRYPSETGVPQQGQPGAGTPGDHRSRPLDRLRQRLADSLLRTRLGLVLGRKNLDYIAETLAMFDRGDYLTALRRSLPLDGDHTAGVTQLFKKLLIDNPLFLDLSVRPRAAARSTILLDPKVMDALRTRYRDAVERLVREGKLEEAAYVLADLLQTPGEATDLLERHGQLELAARLAEARRLPAPTVIRLWLLANNRDRAFMLAAYTGCFEQTIAALKRAGQTNLADDLRHQWAERLLEQGNDGEAADILWQIENERDEHRALVETVADRGGTTGLRMRLRLAAHVHPDRMRHVQMLAALIEDADHPETAKQIAGLMLQDSEPRVPLQSLHRLALRTLMVHAGSDTVSDHAPLMIGLEKLLQPDLLVYHSRKISRVVRERQLQQPLSLSIAETDRGTSQAYDAGLLWNGALAAALGEDGIRIYTTGATQPQVIHQPADHLVLAPGSRRAITVTDRHDRRRRLGIVDLVSGETRYWCDTTLTTWSPTYDGLVWLVADVDNARLIDVNTATFQSIVRWDDTGFTIGALAIDAVNIAIHMQGTRDERWQVERATMALRSRAPLPLDPSKETLMVRMSASGGHAVLAVSTNQATGHQHYVVYTSINTIVYEGTDTTTIPAGFVMAGTWIALLLQTVDALQLVVLDTSPGQASSRSPVVTVDLQGACNGHVRLDERSVVVTDDAGRIVAIDLHQRTVLHNIRVVV